MKPIYILEVGENWQTIYLQGQIQNTARILYEMNASCVRTAVDFLREILKVDHEREARNSDIVLDFLSFSRFC